MTEWIDFLALLCGRVLMATSGVVVTVWLVTIAMDYVLKTTGIWFEIVIAVAERRKIKACRNGTIETQPRNKP